MGYGGWMGAPGNGGMPSTTCMAECPARNGVGLLHARGEKCTDGHAWNQCCDCGAYFTHPNGCRHELEAHAVKPTKIEGVGETITPTEDHLYVFTITGRCARAGCGKAQPYHPEMLRVPQDGCIIDHASVSANQGLLIDDGGLIRKRCPHCDKMVEPKSITGDGPTGAAWGVGRGEWVSPRMEARWNAIAWRAMRDTEENVPL